MTTWMDTAVGKMLGALEKSGLADDTIVVFTSDHGDNLGSNGLVQKGGPNEESVRIPLIISQPEFGIKRTVNKTHIASLVDLAPTLLSLIDVEIPSHFHGRDMSAICVGKQSDIDNHAFIETGNGAAIRTPEFLYHLPFTGKNHDLTEKPDQFYDLIEDPYQLHNLAGENVTGEVAKQLDTKLREWNTKIPWMKNKQ